MKSKHINFIFIYFLVNQSIFAQMSSDTLLKSDDLAVSFAKTVMTTYPDSIVVKKFVQHLLQDKQGADPNKRPASWNYEEAVILKAFERLWQHTGDKVYFDYTKKIVDHFINEDGTIRTYEPNDYNSDQVTGGLQLITLYQATKAVKYRKAAELLRRQITWQPRTKSGGFWHKHKYPYQMWLDGMYMLNVFYATYCHHFDTPQYFDDVALQFILLDQHAKNHKTGLLYHGWDESKSQLWANPETGQSPEVWGRSMGWYMMALVEVLEIFPKKHPKRAQLLAILNNLAATLTTYQDAASGVWYQIVDKANWKGNYLEASGSSMFVYALSKGVRLGFLDKKYLLVAQKGFEGILKNFIDIDYKGFIHIHQSCSGAGLGGVPYRAGDFKYYISEPIRSDDLKTIAPFIHAALEMKRSNYTPKTKVKI